MYSLSDFDHLPDDVSAPRAAALAITRDAKITEGSRNNRLISFAGSLRRQGVDEDVMIEMCGRFNERYFDPPLDADEVRRVAHSAARYPVEPDAVLIRKAAPVVDLQTGEILDDSSIEPYQTFSASEMMNRPPVSFIVEDVIPANGLCAIVAQPGQGKTFYGTDMGMCIAWGATWHGREVRQGAVLYVSAEGASGLGQRIAANALHRCRDAPDSFHVMTDAPQLTDNEQVARLLATAMIVKPVAIFVDTLARTFPGEENSAKEMGAYIAALDLVRKATGAAVIVIHHSNKAGTGARGSSALLGALDVEITLSRDSATLTANITKAKDFAEGEPMTFDLKPVALPSGGSLVLERSESVASGINATDRRVAQILSETFRGEGATATLWREACEEAGISRATFYRARAALAAGGYITAPASDAEMRGFRHRPSETFGVLFGRPPF